MVNLDLLAQRKAQQIIRECVPQTAGEKAATTVENTATKSLGVLQENGLYAAILHLWTRRKEEQNTATKVREILLDTARELAAPEEKRQLRQPGEALKFLSDKVCSDLDCMLLVKQVWEQTLVYTRFAAKAEKGPA